MDDESPFGITGVAGSSHFMISCRPSYLAAPYALTVYRGKTHGYGGDGG
jgi:hypothetical protein